MIIIIMVTIISEKKDLTKEEYTLRVLENYYSNIFNLLVIHLMFCTYFLG